MKCQQITDLALASYLSTKGHRLKGIEGNRNCSYFVFENGSGLKEDSLAFYNRQAPVDALTFAETLRNLKAAAINQQRNH